MSTSHGAGTRARQDIGCERSLAQITIHVSHAHAHAMTHATTPSKKRTPHAFVLSLLALAIGGTAMLPTRLRTTRGSSNLFVS